MPIKPQQRLVDKGDQYVDIPEGGSRIDSVQLIREPQHKYERQYPRLSYYERW